ncbi:MAG: hypothetical protein ACRD4M_01645 [Candidatus Acidiferrales bacterium]
MSMLPGNAPVLSYLDVAALRKIQSLPLGAALGFNSPGPQTDRDYAEFVRQTGFDYSRDLDQAAIAFWPASPDPTPAGTAQDRALAIADGRFDAEKIKSYAERAGGKPVVRGSHAIYEVPGAPPVAFEFLSSTRLAIASGPNPSALLDFSSPAAPRDSATQASIGRVAGAPVFAVARMDHLSPNFYADMHHSPQLEKFVRAIQSLALAGKPDGNQFDVTLEAQCDSMTSAAALAAQLDLLRMVGAMALSDPHTRRQMTHEQASLLDALIHHAKVTHQDKWARLSLAITPEMLGVPQNSSPATPTSKPSR